MTLSLQFMRRFVPLVAVIFSVQACQDLTGSNKLPQGVPDPESIKTAEGARTFAKTATQFFQSAISVTILEGGLMTDELQSFDRGSPETAISPSASWQNLIDSRNVDDRGATLSYGTLHGVRGITSQARGALLKYAPDSENLRGLMYAYAGYAEVFLADLYCSGVPLSTLDFEGDFTVKPGSSTADVYQHAIVFFDSAIALAADSAPVVALASVGKARALLALAKSGETARYSEAEAAVQDVPNDFVWSELLKTCDALTTSSCSPVSGNTSRWSASMGFNNVTVSNNEGGRSVISVSNPRTSATFVDPTNSGVFRWSRYPVYHPDKYARQGVSTIVVASGVEAQLIRAEAALHRNAPGEWLSILNALRAADPRTDTMTQIIDPGNMNARIDTLFAERGQWLFLTGHRQGDLRRFVRNYQRPVNTVYPSGIYPGGIATYGPYVNLPIASSFEGSNSLFQGCLNRGA